MKFIYVLEDDERTKKDLYETLKSIDPKLHIRFFPALAPFHEWLKSAVAEGPKALAKGGSKYSGDTSEDIEPAANHELRLVIAKNEFMGIQNLGLIKRAQEFFLRKNMCTPQEPTALILTAFDSPNFDINLAEERIINNVIFKPFDKLILKQHLEYALTGHHPLNTATVASMKTQSTIEMLKEVSLNSISEVGFTTLNNHEIKIGAMTKYYSESFRSNSRRSLFAFCKSSKQISDKEYLCEFLFFGADNTQIGQIRRNILQDGAKETVEIKNTHGNKIRVLLIQEDEQMNSSVQQFLTEKISNLEIFTYTSYGQLSSDLADKETVQKQNLPPKFDLICAGYEIFEIEKEKRWEQLCQTLKDRAKKYSLDTQDTPDLFVIAKKAISLEEIRSMSTWVKDVFFAPLDRSYILKKLLYQYPSLLNINATQISHMKDSSVLKVANPVEIIQISEAGLVMKYYRAMSIGAFREFILWRPEELETPEIIGTVNFHEKDKNGGDFFLNHFVFFGMRDLYLKHIRLWLREAYIKSKDKS